MCHSRSTQCGAILPPAPTLLAKLRLDERQAPTLLHQFRDTATASTSVAGRNPPDWWDQSDA